MVQNLIFICFVFGVDYSLVSILMTTTEAFVIFPLILFIIILNAFFIKIIINKEVE